MVHQTPELSDGHKVVRIIFDFEIRRLMLLFYFFEIRVAPTGIA
jgi:hypothetical protein